MWNHKEYWINNNVCLSRHRFGNFGFGFAFGGNFFEITFAWFQLWIEW